MFGKIFERVIRPKKEKSLKDKDVEQYVVSLKEDFERIFELAKDCFENTSPDDGQEKFDILSGYISDLENVYEKIENYFKTTKEGEEYFLFDKKFKENSDSLMEVQRNILLEDTPLKDFALLKARLNTIKKEAKDKLIPQKSNIEN